MKSYQRFLVLILFSLVLTAALSPWAAAFWNYVIQTRPEWEKYRYPFSSIFDRLFMVLGVLLFVVWRRWLKIDSFAQLGLQPLWQGFPHILRGFFLAVASMVVLVSLMSLSDVFTPFLRLSFSDGLGRSVKALLQGLTVGFLEEIFFRGILLKGLLEDLRPKTALIATSLFYSAIHFINPSGNLAGAALDPWLGFRHVFYSLTPFLDPINLFPGFFGLFLIGLVLGYAFLRTGSLYLSIGLHAGWVFAIKTVRVFGDFTREDLGWTFGSSDPKIVSGVMSWAMIVLVGLAVYYATRRRQSRGE